MNRLVRLWLLVMLAAAPSLPQAQQAWLVTYGEGSEVWERFGHNALWLRDEATGLDHSFSFGYFELDRPGFHTDFARGLMLYYGAVTTPEREFSFYRGRDRSIMLQRLNLDSGQISELYGLLNDAIFPQPQYYQYHYFLANCSTWLRDLLDQVLDGQIAEQLDNQPARLNFRDHTRRLTAERFWLHTGMMLLLGPEIDRPRSAWEETFLPEALADWLDQVELDNGPLVLEREQIFASQSHHPPEHATGPWLLSLLFGLLAASLVLTGLRWQGLVPGLFRVLGLIGAGLAGCAIFLMWFGSGHESTWRNAMALLLHPFWFALLLPLSPGLKRGLLIALGAGLLAGMIWLAIPLGQWRPDQLLLVVPVLAALLLVSWKRVQLADQEARHAASS